MAGDNKQTDLDLPTRLPELTQNLIGSSHIHSTPSLKMSCKSVQPFSRNVADKETKKERKKSPESNTPSPYRRRGNKDESMRSMRTLNKFGGRSDGQTVDGDLTS